MRWLLEKAQVSKTWISRWEERDCHWTPSGGFDYMDFQETMIGHGVISMSVRRCEVTLEKEHFLLGLQQGTGSLPVSMGSPWEMRPLCILPLWGLLPLYFNNWTSAPSKTNSEVPETRENIIQIKDNTCPVQLLQDNYLNQKIWTWEESFSVQNIFWVRITSQVLNSGAD